MKKAKFQIGDLLPIGITIVVLGIGLAFGLQVIGDVQNDMGETACAARDDVYTGYDSSSKLCVEPIDSNTTEVGASYFNATGDTITGVAKMPAKLPIIVTVIVAAVIIGILVRYLMIK